jgi:beta-glucosidase
LLPLDKSKFKNILVTGPLAADTLTSMSRYGPSNVKVVSVLEGLQNYDPKNVQVKYTKGCESADVNWPESELYPSPMTEIEKAEIKKAVEMAATVDVIVAVMGETENQFGESRSRTNLDLTGRQLDLLYALYATKKPIVVVLINGQPLTINWPAKYIPSILEAWCPGAEGGNAIAETLFGDYNPGGKLPVTIPKSVGQIELNFPYKPGSQAGQPGDGPNGFGKTNIYGALYPFGYGLSYTTFEYSNLVFDKDKILSDSNVVLHVTIKNTGTRRGDEVVQLYVKDEVTSVTVYEKQLRGFERISLAPNESKTVTFTLKPSDISLLNLKMERVVEPGFFEVQIGSSSEDIRMKKRFEVIK